MTPEFESAMHSLFSSDGALLDANALFDPEHAEASSTPSAFLLSLAGNKEALAFLEKAAEPGNAAEFFVNRLDLVEKEIEEASNAPEFKQKLKALAQNPADETCLRNVFFPEGAGLP